MTSWTWHLIGVPTRSQAACFFKLSRQNSRNSPTISTTLKRKTHSNFHLEILKRLRRSRGLFTLWKIRICQRWKSLCNRMISNFRLLWHRQASTTLRLLNPKLNRRENEIKWWSYRYKIVIISVDSSRRPPRTSWTDLAPSCYSIKGSTYKTNLSRSGERDCY